MLKIPFRRSGYSSFTPLEFYIQTRTVHTSFNQISSLHQLTISKFPVNRWHFGGFPSTTIGFPSPAAPRPKAPKRTHVPPRSEETKNAAGGRQVAHVQKMPKKRCGENSEKSKHTTLMSESCNLLRNNLSNFWFFSASERPNVSSWDGEFHEPKKGKRKNEVQRSI